MFFKQEYIASVETNPSILFFDLEMTGGNTRYDEILQFSIVDLYKGVVFNEYIKPRKCKSWKAYNTRNGKRLFYDKCLSSNNKKFI